MSVSRSLLALLVAAAAFADLAVLSRVNPARHPGLAWPDLRLALLFSLVFAQVGLTAIWAVLGRTVLPWRMAGLVAVVVGWSVTLAAVLPGAVADLVTDDAWGVQLLLQAGWVGAVLVPARACGGRLAVVPTRRAERGLRRFQFSLGYLFAWITSTAVVLGLWKFTFDLFPLDASSRFWQEAVAIGAVHAALALMAVWAVLDSRCWCVRLQAAGITAVPVVLVFAFWIRQAGREALLALLVLWLLEAFWLGFAVYVVRVAGYRLRWAGLSCRGRESAIARSRCVPARRVGSSA